MSRKRALLLIWFMAAACSLACAAAERKVTLLVGGDVSWSLEYKAASTVPGEADASDADWRPIPHANTVESHTKNTASYGLHFNSTTEAMRYPFRKLTPLFHSADIVFVNLETPLSDSARQVGDYRTPAAFADALHWAGVTAVSVANNHTFDDEEKGFLDTLHNLRAAGVGYVGGGYSLADARRPLILVRNGIRIGFLGYTQFSNSGDAAFAAPHLPGEAPMDPGLIKEDIEKLRGKVDFIAVSLHWGTDRSANVSRKNRELAHEIIDDGADMVLGGHTPYPKGIEAYHGKVIVYSPAHIFTGHQHFEWGDDYLLRFTLTPKSIEKVEVLPIAGTGMQLSQPFLLKDGPATKLLQTVRDLSVGLDTSMDIQDNEGVILPRETTQTEEQK